ncbi:MAG: FG-GAP-like repeat-containing protein [Bacteroidota bacterium]
MKISFYSSNEGYVAFQNRLGFTTDSGRTFTDRTVTLTNVDYNGYSPNLTFGFTFGGVKAFSKDKVIAYGHYGMVPSILYSSDGGNNFKLVFHNQYQQLEPAGGISDMIFPQDQTTGFACDPDRILKTTNGGLSWNVVRDDANSWFTNLEATDNSNVFAFSNQNYHSKGSGNKLIKTVNGGASWVDVPFPLQSSGHIGYAYFRTPVKGWVTVTGNDNGNYLYRTTDGGNNWILVNDPFITPFGCIKMKFTDDSTGYAAGGLFYFFKTTNGGKIWERVQRDNNISYFYFSYNDLYFLNNQQFWAGGATGLLEISGNGGGLTLPSAFFKIDTTGLTPGQTVNLVNYSKTSYQYKWYVNGTLTSTTYHSSYQHSLSSRRDTVKLIVSNGVYSDTLEKYQSFPVPAIAIVSSFSPGSGSTGTAVSITGSNFTGVNSVSFGGTPASSFTIISPTEIRAIVGNGSSGNVTVGNIYGPSSLAGFTYFPPPVASAPTISSVSPLSGIAGTTVTISGSGFDASAAGNIVRFGIVKAPVVNATATSITCTVPAGASYEPIYVLNTVTHLSVSSGQVFNLVFADSSNFTTSSFRKVKEFSTSSVTRPWTIASFDINEDGRPDLVCEGCAVNRASDSISVYLNTSTPGTISVGEKINIAAVPGYSAHQLGNGDFDGDGKADIATAGNDSHIYIYRNQSVGNNLSFSEPVAVSSGDYVTMNIIGSDIDGDGRPDIVSSNYGNGYVGVLRNTSSPGNLSFAYRELFKADGRSINVASADIDGDGKKDVVTFNYGSDSAATISVFRNNSSPGSVSLAKISVLSTGGSQSGSINSLQFADYDGDHKIDLILTSTDRISIYRNLSTGPGDLTFDTTLHYVVVGTGTGPIIENLSGDDKPDLFSGTWYGLGSTLYRNISTPGSILNEPNVRIPDNHTAYATTFADFDLDGRNDIAALDANFGIIYFLRNEIGKTVTVNTCEGIYTHLYSDFPGTSFQWQVDNGNGYANISDGINFKGSTNDSLLVDQIPLSWNGYKFRCLSGRDQSTVFILQVSPKLVPNVTISVPDSVVCDSVFVTFTPTVTNPGTNTLYYWYVNGKGNGGSYTPTYSTTSLKDGDSVRVDIQTTDVCNRQHLDTSNTIRMTIKGGYPAVSIVADSKIICEGQSATFTATPVWGGQPSYQWQVNGGNAGTNSPVFSSIFANNDKVKLIMTANGECISPRPVTSNTVTMSVSPYVSPALSIQATSDVLCPDQLITFSPSPVNGGSSPIYNWTINGNPQGSGVFLSSRELKAGDLVQCTMTSSLLCLTHPTAVSNSVSLPAGACLEPDNFQVQSTDAGCQGVANGSIHLSAKKQMDYAISIAGDNGYTKTESFNGTSYTSGGLAAGTYQVCVSVNDHADAASCYTIIVHEPPPLRVKTDLATADNLLVLNMEGSATYIITVNGKAASVNSNQASFSLQEGPNEVSVSTGRSCQGLFTQTFFSGDHLHVYPNPVHDILQVWIPSGPVKKVEIISAATGAVVRRIETVNTAIRPIHINVAGLAAGIYIIRSTGNTGIENTKFINQ